MQSLIIDLQGITPEHLRPTDNPVLTVAVEEAINPAPSIAGDFDNKV
jgi:hypothetical protein